jgi:hypothetical protein
MKVYKILPNLYYGGTVELPDGTPGIPYGTTRTEIPELNNGEYAVWAGQSWRVTKIPPAEIVEPKPPVQKVISVAEFFDSFGDQKWNVLSSTDPVVRALIMDSSLRQTIDLDDANIIGVVKHIEVIGIPINVNKVLKIEE